MPDGAKQSVGLTDLAPGWLARFGVRSWLAVGIIALLGVGAWLLNMSSSIVIPLLLAIILGVLFQPVVELLVRFKVPRAGAAGLTMLLILLAVAAIVTLIVQSVGSQMGLIVSQVSSGLTSLGEWLARLNLPDSLVARVSSSIQNQLPNVGTYVANTVLASVTGVAGMLFGAFISFYMLFYTLADWPDISEWIGRSIGLGPELGAAVVDDASSSVRQYFQGTTILALITSIGTGIGLAIFKVPLVIPIMVVTFVLTYIPYFGAIVSSAFAVLIALGAGGPQMALLALIVVLLAQNVLQGAVAGWAIGGALDLHPIVVIVSTMMGGIFGGLIGGMLGAPLVAILVRLVRRLKEAGRLDVGPAQTSAAAMGATD